jgi:hypothetical protein
MFVEAGIVIDSKKTMAIPSSIDNRKNKTICYC